MAERLNSIYVPYLTVTEHKQKPSITDTVQRLFTDHKGYEKVGTCAQPHKRVGLQQG